MKFSESVGLLELLSTEETFRFIERFEGKELTLPAYRPWTDDELASVMKLADRADARSISLVLNRPHADLCTQLDVHRLHRRILVRGRDMGLLDSFRASEPRDADALELVTRFRGEPDHVLAMLRKEPLKESRALFDWIVHAEDSLYAMNLVRPFRDLVPAILQGLDPKRSALLLEGLNPGYAARVLCDDYTRVAPECLGRIFGALTPAFSTRVIRSMLHGADRPRRLAAIIRCTGDALGRAILGRLKPSDLLRLIDAGETQRDAEWVVLHLSDEAAREVLSEVRRSESEERLQRRTLAFLALRNVGGATATDPRQPGWHRFAALETFRPGLGRRVVEDVDVGRWIHIDEVLNGPFGPKRVVADILAIDPSKAELRCVSAPRSERLTIDECATLFPLGSPPGEAAFRKASLFRLREKAQAENADAAINGNFFFDYGHFENAPGLGIDCSLFPSLRFGDPVGWYVEGGREFTPAVLNRCALVLTEDGRPWIQRTKMTRLTIGDASVSWDVENQLPKADELGVYTPLWGQTTPKRGQHIDYAIQGDSIQSSRPGGGIPIPLTGFVLSVPEGDARVHALLQSEEPIRVENNFPKERGRVVEAMACGPQLVRDGETEIDFALEEFGTKDSAVMSFFLPRLVDRYEAARSFVATTKSGTLLLGSVSGRAFGLGGSDQPAGVTFGELAQLASDLGAENAMGLDGGGSSSMIARRGEELKLLNVPTGGADVPRGKERFIANAIMVHRRSDLDG